MSSEIEELLQLYLNVLGHNVIMLRNIGTSDNSKNLVNIQIMQVNYKILSTKIKYKKESKIARKLQQGSKVDLQTLDFKVKVKHVENGSSSKIGIEIINQIYNQRFKKYLDYIGSNNLQSKVLHQGDSKK